MSYYLKLSLFSCVFIEECNTSSRIARFCTMIFACLKIFWEEKLTKSANCRQYFATDSDSYDITCSEEPKMLFNNQNARLSKSTTLFAFKTYQLFANFAVCEKITLLYPVYLWILKIVVICKKRFTYS